MAISIYDPQLDLCDCRVHVGVVGVVVSVKSKLKKAGRMPEVPKSVMIAKCTRCLEYRRLKDISAGVCVEPCEPKLPEPEVPNEDSTKNI